MGVKAVEGRGYEPYESAIHIGVKPYIIAFKYAVLLDHEHLAADFELIETICKNLMSSANLQNNRQKSVSVKRKSIVNQSHFGTFFKRHTGQSPIKSKA